MRKTVLIGGSGFIGSAFAKTLVQCGEEVVSVSRSIKGDVPGIQEVALDASRDTEILQKVLNEGEDIFIFLGQAHRDFDTETEIRIIRNIIDVLKDLPEKRIFFSSSVLVYGDCKESAEESQMLSPIDSYSRFKSECEVLLQKELSGKHQLCILRFSNVYGSEKNKGFIGLVFRKVFEESPEILNINGDGEQLRDYIFIDDVVSALLNIKEHCKKDDVINIATGRSASLLDVVHGISTIAGKEIPYRITGVPVEEVRESRISVEKAREKYHFVSKVDLEQGLRRTYERYRQVQTLSQENVDLMEPITSVSGKKFLFLGGEGFVGRNLAEYFSGRNECISVARKLSIFTKRSDVFLRADPYREQVKTDMDVVVHLIDHSVEPGDIAKEEESLVNNVGIQSRHHLIVFSSAVVYANPNSDYGRRKIELERFYVQYCEKHSIPLTLFRLFNTYGPYQRPYCRGSLVANLLCNFLAGKETEIHDRMARRDFVYAPAISRFVEYALAHRLTGTFDIGSGELTSIEGLISVLEERVLKAKMKISYQNVRESVVEQAAKYGILEKVPRRSLEEGLLKTAEFYRNNLEGVL